MHQRPVFGGGSVFIKSQCFRQSREYPVLSGVQVSVVHDLKIPYYTRNFPHHTALVSQVSVYTHLCTLAGLPTQVQVQQAQQRSCGQGTIGELPTRDQQHPDQVLWGQTLRGKLGCTSFPWGPRTRAPQAECYETPSS